MGMELRVWVDGTQRVVCGVKLTTTCQEIVFALAHATQQAGRFTMIERWRNNERLLSPNEQPLVTLQRWGDRMNEVEFILKKTSTDPQRPNSRPPVNHIPASNKQPTNTAAQQANEIARPLNQNDSAHQQVLTNGHRESPANHMPSMPNHNHAPTDNGSDSMLQQVRPYDPNRRSQAVLGQLTSSSSTLNLGASHIQTAANRLSNSSKPSLSASNLPNSTNNMTALPVSSASSMLRPRLNKEPSVDSNSPSLSINNDPHNGYQLQNDSHQQFVHHHTMSNQPIVTMSAKSYPYEDLYSTINKKRINHLPPAVPAKPRLMNPTLSQQPLQPNNNAQMNFYSPNSNAAMYTNNLRPRHPPGYLEYLEAMANRNSLPPSFLSNPSFMHQSQHVTSSNIFPRQLEPHLPLYNVQPNGSSPASSSASNQPYYSSNNMPFKRTSLGQNNEINNAGGLQNIPPINPKFVESSGLVINRGSAVNVRLASNSQTHIPQSAVCPDDNLNNSSHSVSSSVSQMGLDMLKVIEEQKKVLLNQKNELERLDNDQEYLDAKQSSEQAELINRIENEIRQLEELWKENQIQINKLQNQDFESELEQLKAEQVRMERELANQKFKLTQCESDIAECNVKIEQLEAELNDMSMESDASVGEEGVEMNPNGGGKSQSNRISLKRDDLSPIQTDAKANGSANNGNNQQPKDSKSSEDDDDDDDDSGGNASDDLNTNAYESNKLRSTKEVAYVEKRGLISGIRSLKLDKSKSQNKSIDSLNPSECTSLRSSTTNSPTSKEKNSTINNILDGRCVNTPSNGQQLKEEAVNSNKYEFLMTL